ncbi:hypothetical protein BHM03_00058791 [Ensete ventricosum]|nr:hypothetical protein BHM03_00058791 [Ensete ventricosum]
MGQDQRRDPGSRNRSGALSESVAGGKAAEGEGGDVDVAVDRCFIRGGGYDSTKVSGSSRVVRGVHSTVKATLSAIPGFDKGGVPLCPGKRWGSSPCRCLRWPLLLNPKWRDLKKKREKRRTKSPSRSQTPLPLVMAEEEQKEEKPFPPVITLKVISLLWGDLTGSVEKWVALVRKRSGGFPPSGFPHRHPKGETMPDACPITNRQRRYRLIVR